MQTHDRAGRQENNLAGVNLEVIWAYMWGVTFILIVEMHTILESSMHATENLFYNMFGQKRWLFGEIVRKDTFG